MSKIISQAAIRGCRVIVEEADIELQKAIEKFGSSRATRFPETAYYYPFIYAMTGQRVQKLEDLLQVLKFIRTLVPLVPDEKIWLPYLGDTLDAGIVTLFAEEIITGIRYLENEAPEAGYNGFITDTILRSLGLQLVDGRMPGFACILGAAPDSSTAVKIIRELQERNILIFLCSASNGMNMKEQLESEGVELGWDSYVVPMGSDTVSTIYVLNWAIRAALTFGGHKGGDAAACLEYCRNRVFAFAMVLGPLDDLKYANGAGALNMGFPVIADTEIPEIYPSGVCTYEAVIRELDHQRIVKRSIEVRGVKIKLSRVPVPVLYGAAFEGERVRKPQTRAEFGGNITSAFELLVGRNPSEIEDGKITILGHDLDEIPEGGALPLGIIAEVSGRKMQKDFEPILERQFHRLLNQAMGIFHMGQRNIIWVRISKDAYKSGFRLSHLGVILRVKLMEEFPSIVDKVQITIITDQEKIEAPLKDAIEAYKERDQRIAGMTDESVENFYSCTLCQSFAPTHVCIITPERLGLCGAYNWLDGKAAHEINPTGPNRPVQKGKCLDPVKGKWEGVNEFVYLNSSRTLNSFSAYSILDDPMTSCGCFECIVAVLPGTCGVMAVDREFSGMTPVGMTFSTLAGMVGGGQQVPGFIGIGTYYISSKKFISAEGGIKRLVWTTNSLKKKLKDILPERLEEIGMPDFFEKVADESVTSELDKLVEFLVNTGHPALEMGEMI